MHPPTKISSAGASASRRVFLPLPLPSPLSPLPSPLPPLVWFVVVLSHYRVVPRCLIMSPCILLTCLVLSLSHRCVVYRLVAALRLRLSLHLLCLVDCRVVALNIVGVASPCTSCRDVASRHCTALLHLVVALYLVVAMSLVLPSRPVAFHAAAVAEHCHCNLQRPLNAPPNMRPCRRHPPTTPPHRNI